MFVKATTHHGARESAFSLPAGADRRMARIQRAACVAAYGAMARAGVTTVDGIFSATALGCLEDTERFLVEIGANSGSLLPPLPFMRSTHNTMAGQLALLLKAQGPNITFSQGLFGLHAALLQARLHLLDRPDDTVLVFAADEQTPLLDRIAHQLGGAAPPAESAEAMIISNNSANCLARIERIVLGAPAPGTSWWDDMRGSLPGGADHVIVLQDVEGTDHVCDTLELSTLPVDGPIGTRTVRSLVWVIGRMHEGTLTGSVLLVDRGWDQQGGILVSPC